MERFIVRRLANIVWGFVSPISPGDGRTPLSGAFERYSSVRHGTLPSGCPGQTGALVPDGICTIPLGRIDLTSPHYPDYRFVIPPANAGAVVEVKSHIGSNGTADEKIFAVPYKYSMVHKATGMIVLVVVCGLSEGFLHRAGAFGLCDDKGCMCHSADGRRRTEHWERCARDWRSNHVHFVPASALCSRVMELARRCLTHSTQGRG